MRIAVAIHDSDIDRVIEMYNLMPVRYFSHSSPSLFNAGALKPMKDDSIEEPCYISMTAGGIGLSIHCVCATKFVLFIFFASVYVIKEVF